MAATKKIRAVKIATKRQSALVKVAEAPRSQPVQIAKLGVASPAGRLPNWLSQISAA
jgi:hypothetical protein